MRTAIDTNILSAIWSNEPHAANIPESLAAARGEGALIVSAPVYVELLAYPNATEAFLNRFLGDTGISVDFDLSQPVWLEAGRRFARHAHRRRQSRAQEPKRFIADFVIGSHALKHADRLMTLDPKRYQRDFPELNLF
ncbi:MAG TPA: type II toxin-antitoxin system VapC family toxin [Candidatus Acidoferrales bacterium]